MCRVTQREHDPVSHLQTKVSKLAKNQVEPTWQEVLLSEGDIYQASTEQTCGRTYQNGKTYA